VHDNTRTISEKQPQTGVFLTPKDLQRELQIGEKLCYRLLQSGAIPSVRIGNLIRVYRPHFEEALLEEPDLARKRPGWWTRPNQ
jgi:excisionase family DNA binding protein